MTLLLVVFGIGLVGGGLSGLLGIGGGIVGIVIASGMIESGVRRVGAEQEMFLVDSGMRPMNVAGEVVREAWYFNTNYPWLGMLFCAPIIGLWYWCTDQYIVQRALGAPNEREARRGCIFASYLKLLPVFIFIIPGVIAYALEKQGELTLESGDQACEIAGFVQHRTGGRLQVDAHFVGDDRRQCGQCLLGGRRQAPAFPGYQPLPR